MKTIYRYIMVDHNGKRSLMNFGGKTEFTKPLDENWVQLNFNHVAKMAHWGKNRDKWSLIVTTETRMSRRMVQAAIKERYANV